MQSANICYFCHSYADNVNFLSNFYTFVNILGKLGDKIFLGGGNSPMPPFPWCGTGPRVLVVIPAVYIISMSIILLSILYLRHT